MRRRESSFSAGMNGVMGVGCGCLIMIAAPMLLVLGIAICMPAIDAARAAREKNNGRPAASQVEKTTRPATR